MKRWAVFEDIDSQPRGGMNDFVASFESLDDANKFAQYSDSFHSLVVVDMRRHLEQPSPVIPTKEEYDERIRLEKIAYEEHLRNETPLEKYLRMMAGELMARMINGPSLIDLPKGNRIVGLEGMVKDE